MSIDEVALKGLRDAAQSLKLYRRAELRSDEGDELVEQLYVDPLPNDHVLETMLRPNTTFLVGRKGTGKSTVFQRAQYELRQSRNVATAYVDIKSVFESSRIDADISELLQATNGALPPEALERLLLNRDFFLAILTAIREEIEKRNEGSLWSRIRASLDRSAKEMFEGLDGLISSARRERFENVLGVTTVERMKADSSTKVDEVSGKASLSANALKSGVAAEVGAGHSTETSAREESRQVDVLMRVFDLRGMINELRTVLNAGGVKHLYVFLDDFSELPESSMRIVVDALLAPLNNWSDELVKFKIAAYPTRIYYGTIDPSKIDTVNLDLFNLYGASDLAVMEEKAVDFTRRLVERRLAHYGVSGRVNDVFDLSGEELWRQLFDASMANPRTLGYLLYFAYESFSIYGRRIGASAVRDAAHRYYEDKIRASFNMNRFLNESFAERSSIFSLKELLDEIVAKARALRKSDASLFRGLEGRFPTSHFHVDLHLEPLMNSLELNFFVTKYYVMSDKDGKKVAVYALNYGLCQVHNIEFGRPSGAREQRFRQYYAQRVFDYSPLLNSYVRTHQEIICSGCGARHDFDMLPALRTFGMLCPSCKAASCDVVNLSRKYEAALREVDESTLLPAVELGILQTLDADVTPLNASDVAGELDCSYQLVGKRVKHLDERGLVDRNNYQSGRRVYATTDLAKTIYFSHGSSGAGELR